MHRHYFFRKGDLKKWLKAYRESQRFLYVYQNLYDENKRREEIDSYDEANEIISEYRIFISSLSEKDKSFLKEALQFGMIYDSDLKLHPEIIENWEIIVLHPKKHQLKDLDLKEIGKKLKKRRISKGIYRAEAARYIGISERTLKYFEDGEREMGIKTYHKLCQLYEIENPVIQ